ncbi:hypothetical protein C6T65_09195 [Burkholderia vietnamiensis]|uniref:Uncharacterized protein n=1 Tax=Burkholderia vietnamiensis TaxID=60552 RepID=A0AA44Y1R1_BURVI|nr:hypothetical protein C6T65_09195 [Burkholderia vietnamiensis]
MRGEPARSGLRWACRLKRHAARDARAERASMPRCGREYVNYLNDRVSVRTRVSPCEQPAVQLHAGQHTIADIARALRCNKKQP